MIPKYVFDTSFILALLFEKDYYHEQAKQIYKHLPDNAVLITHHLVIPEASSVVCRRCKERKINCSFALSTLKEFFKRINISFQEYSYEKIVEEMNSFGCELSFVDIVLLKETLRLKAFILTFDQKLKEKLKLVKQKREGS